MDKKKIEYFRKRLEVRQQDLRRMVSRTEQDGRSVDEGSAQDVADKAANSYNKEFLFHQSNNDRQLLQMVDGALSRMREGNFGECISCGEEIRCQAPGSGPLDAPLHRMPGEAGAGTAQEAQRYAFSCAFSDDLWRDSVQMDLIVKFALRLSFRFDSAS